MKRSINTFYEKTLTLLTLGTDLVERNLSAVLLVGPYDTTGTCNSRSTQRQPILSARAYGSTLESLFNWLPVRYLQRQTGLGREREMFHLTTHSTHFIYGYMVSDIWLRTILIVRERERERERNVLFNDALNTFYNLRLYGVRHMVKDHSDSEKGNPLPPHGLLLLINSKGSFIFTIPQTG